MADREGVVVTDRAVLDRTIFVFELAVDLPKTEAVTRLFPVRGDGERRVVDVERLVVLL